jgi:hypothetical protein
METWKVVIIIILLITVISVSIWAIVNATTTTPPPTSAPTTTATAQTTAPTTAAPTTAAPTTPAPIRSNCVGQNATFNKVGNNGESSSFPFTLNLCDSLVSPDGSHTLAVQSDGNVVLYNNNKKTAPWSLNQIGAPMNATYLTLQSDNNICTGNGNGNNTWCTMTIGKGGNKIVMQNDGNFVQYADGGRPTWATGLAAETSIPSAIDDLRRFFWIQKS